MKKPVLAVLVMLLLVQFVSAEGNCSKKSCKNPSMAEKYIEYAEGYEKQAARANEKGNYALADALEMCAKAKRKIAQGYSAGDKSILNEGCRDYKAARAKLATVKADTCSKKKQESNCKKSEKSCDYKKKDCEKKESSSSSCDKTYKWDGRLNKPKL